MDPETPVDEVTDDAKAVGSFTVELKSVKEADDGTFEAVLSMPTVDRDNEVVDAKAFEPLPARIPIDVDHGMTTVTTVGSGVPYYDGDVLKLRDGRFASTPLGQEVRTLVTEGHVPYMSVAFITAEREVDEKDGKVHVRSAELLNATFTPVPSNREAIVLAAKVGARNSSKDLERIQAMHDHCVELGAGCSGKHATADDTKTPADTNPETTAAPAAVEPPAEVLLARLHALVAEATLTLL